MNEFILYSYFRSSASFRVRIALNYKGIPYEYRAVHLLNNGGEQHSEHYRKLNPSGDVPTLIHKEQVIGQSMAIIDYLDHVHPERALFPREMHHRALVMQACEIINSGIQPVHNLRVLQALSKNFGADDKQKDAWVVQWIEYGSKALEAFLKPHAGHFAFGDMFTAADCFAVPHFFNMDRYKISIEPYPTLKRIKESSLKLEPVQNAAPDRQPDFPKPTT